MSKEEVQKQFDYLKACGLICYGRTIPQYVLENAFGITYKEKDPWPYKNACIQLRLFLEKKGYLTSERHCEEGDFQILPRQSLADKTRCMYDRNLRQFNRRKECIQHVLTQDVSENERIKLNHSLNLFINHLQAKKSILAGI